ncbi:hypothetical protein [Streptomyces collinus]|uniref:hypothetical protein n=1 Tax=Streptomyces collinus TaxID=42684 RepID=UPI00362B62C4
MPTRTMLPPNLTRHFYETRRAFLRSAGQDSTPWFQLSPMDRAVVESEMEIFRQAIRSAEEEQDLIASLDATRAAAAAEETPAEETSAAAEEDAPEDCCLGCAAVAAVLALIEAMSGQQEPDEAPGQGKNSFPFNIAEVTSVPLDTRSWGVPLSEDEKTRLQEAAKGKLPAWLLTAGIDLDVLDGTAPSGPFTFDARPISVERLLVKNPAFDDVRAEFWLRKPPTVDKA